MLSNNNNDKKGDKLQDSYFTFQELSDKNSATSYLLNSQAVCQINQGKFDEAQGLVQEALDKVILSMNISIFMKIF